jgi:hypothetical protein
MKLATSPGRTEVQIFTNANNKYARRVFLRAWTLVDWFPPVGSWYVALTHPSYSNQAYFIEETHQDCHARPGRTTDDKKEGDDKADDDTNLDTPNNSKYERKSHESHIDP